MSARVCLCARLCGGMGVVAFAPGPGQIPAQTSGKVQARESERERRDAGGGGVQSWGPPRQSTGKSPNSAPHPRTCPPNVPASPYRGRSNHGIRVTVSRDVDMKRKVDAKSVIQSLSHPASSTTQHGGKKKNKKERKKREESSCTGLSRGAARGAAR